MGTTITPPPDPSAQSLPNPFNVDSGASTAPGFLGQSPDFWRGLSQWGFNTAAAANQRTADGHLANASPMSALAAGFGQTMQDTQNQAKARSELASQRLTQQGQQMQNQLTASQLPLMLAKNQMLADYYKNPNDPRFQMPGTQAQPGTSPLPVVSDYASTVNADEGSGKDPRSSAIGGIIDRTWNQFAAENPQYFTGMNPDQIGEARSDPKLRGVATDWLATKNAPVLTANGVQPSGPSLRIAHFLGPVAAAAVMKASPETPVDDILNQALGPDMTKSYVAANPNLAVMTAGGIRNHYANVPDPSFLKPQGGQTQSGQAQGGQPNQASGSSMGPQQSEALARQFDMQAQQYQQQANWLQRQQSFGLPIPGDPTLLRNLAEKANEAALKLRTAGPESFAAANAKNVSDLNFAGNIARQKAENSNIDARPGGMIRTFDPVTHQQVFIKNPQVEDTVDDDGATIPMHVLPPMPGSPPNSKGTAERIIGPNGQPIVKKLPPNVQDARNKAYTDFAGKDADAFVASGNTQGLLTQMNAAADELNKQNGFLNTGPLAPERLGFAAKVNDITNTFGLGRAFDPSAIGAWEELTKATKTAGFELASHYEGHARQAAQTIENATSAVPSEVNSPIGFQKVSAGVNEIAQQNRDAYAFAKQPVYNARGDLTKAETDFYTKFPAQMYARRAISTVQPYPITNTEQSAAMKEMERYLPGTFVKLANGKVIQVPARADAPPIPDYLAHYTPQQAQSGAPQ